MFVTTPWKVIYKAPGFVNVNINILSFDAVNIVEPNNWEKRDGQ